MDEHKRASIAEAILQGIDPDIDHATGHVKVAVYVDDFTQHLKDCGFKVVPADEGSEPEWKKAWVTQDGAIRTSEEGLWGDDEDIVDVWVAIRERS